MMALFGRKKKDDRTLEVDRPVQVRLDNVASRLERVTEQLEDKLAELRAERDRRTAT